MSEQEPAFVYIFGNHEWNCYKIGRSKTPGERRAKYAQWLPFSVELVHSILCDDPKTAEAKIHVHLQPKRLRGEWFRIDASRLDALGEVVSFENGTWYDVHNQPIRLLSPGEADWEEFLHPQQDRAQANTLVDSRVPYTVEDPSY